MPIMPKVLLLPAPTNHDRIARARALGTSDNARLRPTGSGATSIAAMRPWRRGGRRDGGFRNAMFWADPDFRGRKRKRFWCLRTKRPERKLDTSGLTSINILCKRLTCWLFQWLQSGFFQENVLYPIWTCTEPIFSDSRCPMIIFADFRDPIFNSSDPNRVPKTP